jgi:hypothetical protein
VRYRNDLTQDRLRDALRYDSESGEFIWNIPSRYKPELIGAKAGSVSRYGYIEIRIGRRLYKAHRLAWLYVHGRWPDDALDHIDGNRQNNRIANLREASYAENSQNHSLRRNNSSGHQGVCFDALRGKWVAQLNVGKRNVLRKRYAAKDEAISAYLDAKRMFHKFNPVPRCPSTEGMSVLVCSTEKRG